MNKLLATLIIAACSGLAFNTYAADAASAPAGKTEHAKKEKKSSSSHKEKEHKSSKPSAKASEPK